ncbi:Protein OSB2 [Cardamine amara subsp. amara]|uniref:Protein OSB2 n=1 Tax=Cardamine amara subsp. amara TaxID=228776 RepID=A0ABD1AUH6_CARAN
MNLISKSLTRIECSPFLHPRPLEIPNGKRITSSQIRLYTAAALGGKTGTGGKKQRAKAPAKTPEVVIAAPVTATTTENELARPNEIAYDAQVANWVNLIGFVNQPVQFEASSDGKFWAGTVISQRSGSEASAFWIPIIFEGDLAKTAAQYINKDDQIHVSGKLFIDSPPPNMTYAQANVQVLVQNLNFLQPPSPSMVVSSSEKEESGIKKPPARAKKDIIVMDEASDSWNHLIENPKEWWDHRENKVNGLVKPRHPDFKSKDSSLSLWLNKAPNWVLPKLEGLEFDVLVPKARVVKQLKGEESWKDLVQNPDKWWDNRIDKRNAKAPDFKHKETGEALWLNESPTWVLPKLPPVKKKQESIVA